jgi:tetratricopeptide (TPR) repeat protein
MGFFASIYQRLRGFWSIQPRAKLSHETLTEVTAESFAQLAREALVHFDFDAAIAHYTQAINLAPHVAQNYFDRGAILTIHDPETAQDELTEEQATANRRRGQADYQMAIRLDPSMMEKDFKYAYVHMLALKYIYKPTFERACKAMEQQDGDETAA